MKIIQTGLFDAVVVGDGMGYGKIFLMNMKNLNGEIICGKQHPINIYITGISIPKSQIERMKSNRNG